MSFVLGFALASLIAWLGSVRGDEVTATAATLATEPVATAVTPVVTPATEEKTSATPTVATAQPAPKVTPPSATRSVPPAPAPRSVAAQPQRTAVAGSAITGYRGVVAFDSTPEGAEVLVNGQVVGQTPVVVNDLTAGSRVVVVRREGYAPWSASIRVVANQRTTVRATLIPVR